MKTRQNLQVRTAALALALASVMSACGVKLADAGQLRTGPPTTQGDVLGSEITPSSSTAPPTTAPAPADVEVIGDDGSKLNDVVRNAIADLQSWWESEYPDTYDGQEYEPVSGGFFAIDSSTSTVGLPCALKDIESVLNNAYYCPPDDAVAWDQETLFPDLAKKYGDFTVAVVLAHEWGHAIQARAEVDESTVTMELQADCFAGSWVQHVRIDEDSRFDVSIEDLDLALAGILSLRDAPGSPSTDPNAHGSGFDRVGAFQEGFEDGSTRCANYRDGDPEPYQFEFSDQTELESGGDLPFDEINTSAFKSLELFWADEFPKVSDGEAWEALGDPVAFGPDDPPSCNGNVVDRFRLFYCVPDRFVGFDDQETMPEAYKLGDFAVGALYGTQYGLAVQDELGLKAESERAATLRGDCYMGAWAGALLPTAATNQGEELPYELILSPGDLDEAVAVLLSFRTDADRSRQGPGFERVQAFRAGVIDGAKDCATLKPE